jgi:hypothetical protein
MSTQVASRWFPAAALATAACLQINEQWGSPHPAIGMTVGLPMLLGLLVVATPLPTNRPGHIARTVLLVLLTLSTALAQPRICAILAIFLFHYFSTLYSEESLTASPSLDRANVLRSDWSSEAPGASSRQ